jgi:hypothetical protein
MENGGDADKYLAAKDKEDPFRLMGFGAGHKTLIKAKIIKNG